MDLCLQVSASKMETGLFKFLVVPDFITGNKKIK